MDKAQQASNFITTSCPRVGAFHGTSEPYLYLKETASQMRASKPSAVFPDRYIEHVAYAVDMVASNTFLSPPAAVASVYLATRFEFYFRILSGKLNGDGTWKSQSAQQAAQAAIVDGRLNRNRVSSVALAYKVMKLNQSTVVQYCEALDRILYTTPLTAVGNFTVADLGDRIEFGRHSAGHGYWGDISAEAVFYGLMTAIIFYGQA